MTCLGRPRHGVRGLDARQTRKRDWGTTAVLLADLVATMAVAIWGILYVKTDLKYLLIIAAITFGLAILVAMLLRASRNHA